MTRTVINLDTGAEYIFTAKTAYEAIRKMIYTLNISGKCDAVINKTESGKTLYIEHKGNTYSTVNV